jgi:hypothetical protein
MVVACCVQKLPQTSCRSFDSLPDKERIGTKLNGPRMTLIQKQAPPCLEGRTTKAETRKSFPQLHDYGSN